MTYNQEQCNYLSFYQNHQNTINTEKENISRSYKSLYSNINDLCPEIFQTILERFIKCHHWRKLLTLRLVCKTWKNNIDKFLSSRQCFKYSSKITNGTTIYYINYTELIAILSFFPNICLIIINNFIISNNLFDILATYCNRLERINLSNCKNVTSKGLKILNFSFQNLMFIDVSNCELDESSFCVICEEFKQLKTLNAIRPGLKVTGLALGKLGNKIEDLWIGLNQINDPNPALISLTEGYGKNLTHFGLIINNFQKTSLNVIANSMKKLKSFKLTFISYGAGNLEYLGKLELLESIVLIEDSRNDLGLVLTDKNLIKIFTGCKILTSIVLGGTVERKCSFTNETVKAISCYCPNVQQIKFFHCQNLDNEIFIELRKLQSIFELEITSVMNISDTELANFLIKKKKTFRTLRVSICPNITEAIIIPMKEIAKYRCREVIKLFYDAKKITWINDIPNNLIIEFIKPS